MKFMFLQAFRNLMKSWGDFLRLTLLRMQAWPSMVENRSIKAQTPVGLFNKNGGIMNTLSKQEQFEEAIKEVAYYLRFKLKKEIRELLAPVYSDLREIHWQTERTADKLSAPITMKIVDTTPIEEMEDFDNE